MFMWQNGFCNHSISAVPRLKGTFSSFTREGVAGSVQHLSIHGGETIMPRATGNGAEVTELDGVLCFRDTATLMCCEPLANGRR